MTTDATGASNTLAMVGFGTRDNVTATGGTINIAGLTDVAFSMPRAGVIVSLAAYFSVGATVDLLGSTVTITAQLYSSPTPNDSFTAVGTASVTLPALSGVVTAGTVVNGITTGLSAAVTAQTRLLLVFSAAVTSGTAQALTVTGYASAGLTLE